MAATTSSNCASKKNKTSCAPPRTAADYEAGQNLCDFSARAWQEHDAALALQQMRTRTLLWDPRLSTSRGLGPWHYAPRAEAAPERCRLSTKTDNQAESETSDPCSELHYRSSNESLKSKASSKTTIEEAKQMDGDPAAIHPYRKTEVSGNSRGNKIVAPISNVAETMGGTDKNASASASASNLEKAPVRGPEFRMTLRPSNGKKSARIRRSLKG